MQSYLLLKNQIHVPPVINVKHQKLSLFPLEQDIREPVGY